MQATHIANPVSVNAATILDVTELPSANLMLRLSDGRNYEADTSMTVRYCPVVGDYLVTQEDGYEYLNPKDVFEHKYSLVGHGVPAAGEMTAPGDFAFALDWLRAGRRVARKGWNGKGMFVFLIQGSNDIAKLNGYGFGEMAGEPTFRDAIFMRTVDNKLVPWTASQTDVLAEDWQIAE